MSLSPIVSGTGLAEHKVIRAKDLTIGTRSDTVHGPRLKIHKNSTRNIAATGGLIEINVDTFKLEISSGSIIPSGLINAMLITDNFPELCTDLVAALASLDVQDFSHVVGYIRKEGAGRSRNGGSEDWFDGGRKLRWGQSQPHKP
ncbi:hypothetical protein Ccrd_007580 [Cynara cardunculus var. scolymus]|uniref:Uncharacterized protein n=1 Tax=Cynara cardunculus var. scolymus TaxID=59895 RepID=A0A103XGU6_CYNCS|nr:hypothetical protein Ccrd_007580 [Cynara cardunculus var. scolymus]